MKTLGIWLASFVLLSLESPMLETLQMSAFAPDVTIVAALYLGTTSPFVTGLAAAALLGLMRDGFALSSPVGLYAELTALAFLASRSLSKRVDLKSPIPLMATAAGLCLASNLLFLVLSVVFHREFVLQAESFRMVLPLALLTMLVAPIQFALLATVERLFRRRRDGDVLFG